MSVHAHLNHSRLGPLTTTMLGFTVPDGVVGFNDEILKIF